MYKHKKKIVLITSVLTTITLMVVSTVAWFFVNKHVEIDYGSDIVCEAGNSLEISIDDGVTWTGKINRTGFSSRTVDISGNGLVLYKPLSLDEANLPTRFEDAKKVDETGAGEFVEFNLLLRSTSKMNVYFNGESSIKPKSIANDNNIFGKFSKDYIAGSMRVAVIDNNNNIKMVWAPNPTYQLTRAQNGSYTFNAKGDPDSKYEYWNGVSNISYTTDDYAKKSFVIGSTNTTPLSSENSPILTSLDPIPGEYDQKSLTIRIWFEGTDREADQALSGGSVSVNLKLCGIQKSESSLENQTKINNITFNEVNKQIEGLEAGMIFSTDGHTWKTYSIPKDLPSLANDFTLYFKYAETENILETAYKKVSKVYPKP